MSVPQSYGFQAFFDGDEVAFVTDRDKSLPVHRKIRIVNNTFRTFGNPLFQAQCASHLQFRGNRMESSVPVRGGKLFFFDACTRVVIADNCLQGAGADCLEMVRMNAADVTFSGE